MSDDEAGGPDHVAQMLAEIVVGHLAAMWPPDKAVMVMFHPADPPERHVLFSNAAAVDLVPVLRAVLARLESGELRMPTGDGVRFVDTSAPWWG
jgi:hypothetical protein